MILECASIRERKLFRQSDACSIFFICFSNKNNTVNVSIKYFYNQLIKRAHMIIIFSTFAYKLPRSTLSHSSQAKRGSALTPPSRLTKEVDARSTRLRHKRGRHPTHSPYVERRSMLDPSTFA